MIKKLEEGFYRVDEHDISFSFDTKKQRWRVVNLTTGDSIELSKMRGIYVIEFLDWLCKQSKKSSNIKEDHG